MWFMSLPGLASNFWKHEHRSPRRFGCSAAFPTRGRLNDREGFKFVTVLPLVKLGNAIKPLHIRPSLTFSLHTVRWRTSQRWQKPKKSTEIHSRVLPNAAAFTGRRAWWLKFVFKGLDYTTPTTMRTDDDKELVYREEGFFGFVDYSIVLQTFTLMS